MSKPQTELSLWSYKKVAHYLATVLGTSCLLSGLSCYGVIYMYICKGLDVGTTHRAKQGTL